MLADINITRNKEKYPNFTSRIPKGIFYSPKDIPHLRCAKCNCHMLSNAEERAIAYRYAPLSPADVIKKITQDTDNKMPQGVTFVKNLFENFGISGVKKFYFENIDKTIDESSEKVDTQIHKVLTKALQMLSRDRKEERLPRPKVMKNLKKIKSELPKETEELVDILLRYTEQFPDMSLDKIIKDERLYSYHKLMLSSQQDRHNLKCEMKKAAFYETIKRLPREKIKQFETLTEEAFRIAGKKSMSDSLRREQIDEVYAPFLENLRGKVSKKRLEKEIKDIDLAHSTGDYLFCRLNQTKDLTEEKVIDFIIYPLKNTYEHVVPKSLGGDKSVENGIYMCTHCNHERGNIPYEVMMKVFPEFAGNVQKQVSRLSTFIKKGALIGYDDYPQAIKRTMKEVSGQDINIDRFLRDQRKVLEKRIEDKKKELSRLESLKASLEYKREDIIRQMEATKIKFGSWKLTKIQGSILKYDEHISEIERNIYYDQEYLKSIEGDLSKKD